MGVSNGGFSARAFDFTGAFLTRGTSFCERLATPPRAERARCSEALNAQHQSNVAKGRSSRFRQIAVL
jgi:hypothetical protein